MTWIAICIPLMIIAIAVATVPLVWAMVHQHRYGSSDGPRRSGTEASIRPTSMAPAASNVCTVCSAVVADVLGHRRAIHVEAA